MKTTSMKLALLGSALAFAAFIPSGTRADTTVTSTTVSQVDLPHTQRVDFSAFDLNHDGVLSTAEVGEKLFYLFDQDGNHVIDNIEYHRKSVLTIIPMKETTMTYHVDDSGNVDQKATDQADFVQHSGLARFDKNGNGLSPEEFLNGKAFNEVDVNHDGVIDINEWKGAYIKSIDKKNREAARYND